jgi:sigma-B regulation protein RsbU (phosphoserine phosphatase)
MGLFCGGAFSVRALRLEPGDTLFLCTDGLTETMSRGGEEYGLERLEALLAARNALPPAALVEACIADLDAFRAGTPRTDDLTLMAVRRQG